MTTLKSWRFNWELMVFTVNLNTCWMTLDGLTSSFKQAIICACVVILSSSVKLQVGLLTVTILKWTLEKVLLPKNSNSAHEQQPHKRFIQKNSCTLTQVHCLMAYPCSCCIDIEPYQKWQTHNHYVDSDEQTSVKCSIVSLLHLL